MPLKAGIIGLGKIGARFDEEAGRKTVWTHAGAYAALPDAFDLRAACDPLADNRERFAARYPGVMIYADAAEMLAAGGLDVISICTPPASHAALLLASLQVPGVRVIWCEKPVSMDMAEAEMMAHEAATRRVPVLVSHVRRWTPLWRELRALGESGTLGTIQSIRVAMPNRLWAIGSHAVDLALMLGGPIRDLLPLHLPALDEDGEPAVAAMLAYESGACGFVQVVGERSALMVEAELIGSAGRARAREDRGEIAIERFAPSSRYDGYRELGETELRTYATLSDSSPFIEVAKEIAGIAHDQSRRPTCGIADAVNVQRCLHRMASA